MKAYPDYIKRWNLWAVVAALIVWTGCTDDIEFVGTDYGTTPSDCLAFTATIEPETTAPVARSSVAGIAIDEEQWVLQTALQDSVASRGTLANHLTGEAGVLGFQYDEESAKFPISENNNIGFTFKGDRLVSTNTTILWNTITAKHLNVYSYVPYQPANTDPTEPDSMKIASETAPPKIDYIVPDLIAHQKDILVSRWISTEQENPDDYKKKTIHLTFNHALTAVRFRVGFDCTVMSVEIRNVHNHGEYSFLDGEWKVADTSPVHSYKISFGDNGQAFRSNAVLGSEYMILMPQTLPEGAKIVLTCKNADGSLKEYTADAAGWIWDSGKRITYTFYQGDAPGTIYFDLAAGDVAIDGSSYSGKVYKNGTEQDVSGAHVSGNHYYVYQSSAANRAGIWEGDVCTPPHYDDITAPDGRSWREFITNNPDVTSVIEAWDKYNTGVATAVGREATEHRITITGAVTCDITIDNIFSTYQYSKKPITARDAAGITFVPFRGNASARNSKVTVKIVGDNRIGAVHYANRRGDNGNEIIFEGTGSLTVADVDGVKVSGNASLNAEVGISEGQGYWSNHWCSAIGGNDDTAEQESNGIVINSGIIFAGTTKAENCTAIGGGGNVYGKVIINGGTVTAVATTTGTAIGGGIGFNGLGGVGEVTITGGNIYAYNHENKWGIPSSAIGGAGSKNSRGQEGIVKISGGYVYAESTLGTAIGGGSSYSNLGGYADIEITGGEIFAKTGSRISSSIGGGTACSNSPDASSNYDGGYANISISGSPVLRTGSVGGGGTGAKRGHIGNATINISGGDIQAQFLLSAGTGKGDVPTFTMTDGMIRNSDTEDDEYFHVKPDGGVVYLENGSVNISGGTIRDCKAQRGGAIYIAGSYDNDLKKYNASFTMSGGLIEDNEAYRSTGYSDEGFEGSGGAIYIIDGTVDLTGGTIADNLAAGGNGGGVFIRRGSLTVSGTAKIINNASEIRKNHVGAYGGGNGGGIYVYSKVADVDVILKSGTITGNTADRRGGGLCVIQDNSDAKAKVTLGTEGGADDGLQITGNHALLQGGGVYAKGANVDMTINSGTIMDNTVSQYVHNQNVANEGGAVTLNGGLVTHNIVTFNANYEDAPDAGVQKIVTDTNSTLVTPELTRLGYRLTGWNSKPSGAGDHYFNGQIMNIDKDITLYAQWERR